MIDDMLRDLGYAISAWASDIRSARQELRKKDFDVALLNIVLDGRRCPELADALLEMGKPFVFVNDGQQTEQRHATVPLLHKPFAPAEMRSLLEGLVGPGDALDEIADAN